MPSGERSLALGAAFEGFKAPGHRSGQAGRLDRVGAHDEKTKPPVALVIGGHRVGALEDCLLDAAVG
jgi:hypothetical protein